jgi:hypothetical protein
MTDRIRGRRIAASLVIASLGLAPYGAVSAGAAAPAPDHSAYDDLLGRYVTPGGVRYTAWHASASDREALQEYLDRMADVAPSELPREDRLAYWINVYNAVTLDLILDGYPVKSIKDLGGVIRTPWKKELITIDGEKRSLDEIENEIIRPRFQEPRIHFALNCAAVSCPPLRAEAFVGAKLEAQLQEQTTSFLAGAGALFPDGDGRLRLSRIFDWYRTDFESDGSLQDWVRPYVPALAALDSAEDVEIRFLDYDWSLNGVAE